MLTHSSAALLAAGAIAARVRRPDADQRVAGGALVPPPACARRAR